MTTEFEKRIKLFNLDNDTTSKLMALITEAGKEFPCQKCPSKDECENYKWFLKWFNG